MLSVYKLTNAINESASGIMSVDSIAPYQFIGGLDEATSEMNFVLMAEATDIASLYTGATEIMTEAAINNPSSLNILSENVFQTIGAKMKAFIDKVIAMVKGMIEKIKAFFYKLTGKIDKWLNIMKPRITKASGYSGASDQTVDLHNWDVDYIATEGGMVTAMSALADVLTTHADDKFAAVEAAKTEVGELKTKYMGEDMRDKTGDDTDVKAAIEKLDSAIEQSKDDKSEAVENRIKDFAEKLNVSDENPSSMEDIWSAVTRKATGGEKVSMKFSEAAGGKGVDGMLRAIEGSKKSINALKKTYEKHLSQLSKLKSKVEKTYKTESKVDKIDKYPSELRGKYQSLVTELSNEATRGISIMESALNTAKSKHIAYVQQMTSEYMNALSKYANYKGKKKDEA